MPSHCWWIGKKVFDSDDVDLEAEDEAEWQSDANEDEGGEGQDDCAHSRVVGWGWNDQNNDQKYHIYKELSLKKLKELNLLYVSKSRVGIIKFLDTKINHSSTAVPL